MIQNCVLILALTGALSGCGLLATKGPRGSSTAAMDESAVAFRLTSLPPISALQQRASALNEASWPLYLNLAAANPDSNLLLSPVSLQAAMGLLYPGTAGETGTEMATVFKFDPNQTTAATNMEGLLLDLTTSSTSPSGTISLSITNRLWSDPSFTPNPSYLDTLKRSYNTGISLAPMQRNPSSAVDTINATIAADTDNHIQDLLPRGSLDMTPDSAPAMVLTNAIYLQAPWSLPFQATATAPAVFTKADGSQVTVQMMNQNSELSYTSGSNYQAVELPYAGNDVAMLVILPNQGVSLAEVESSLGVSGVNTILQALSTATVQLALPKFSFHWGTTSLKSPLEALGLVQAFDPLQANFNLMPTAAELAGGYQLFVRDIFQETYIDVDEAGTTAAAATADNMDVSTAYFSPSPTFTVDRPALLALVSMHTGAELFLGRLMAP